MILNYTILHTVHAPIKITNSLFLPLDAIFFFSCISSSFPQRLYRHNLKNEPDNCDTKSDQTFQCSYLHNVQHNQKCRRENQNQIKPTNTELLRFMTSYHGHMFTWRRIWRFIFRERNKPWSMSLWVLFMILCGRLHIPLSQFTLSYKLVGL